MGNGYFLNFNYAFVSLELSLSWIKDHTLENNNFAGNTKWSAAERYWNNFDNLLWFKQTLREIGFLTKK